MKTQWDYTELAQAYLSRPDYAQSAIDAMVSVAGVGADDSVCDVGAGAAHLTLMLAKKSLRIFAVEPNDAMRNNGVKKTAELTNVSWYEGVGEKTGMESERFNLVTFGSSFNVCDRSLALKETARILKPGGWFACMWNHRDLSDPLQGEIENIIKEAVPDYSYGTRREDQTQVIEESNLFGDVIKITGNVTHEIPSLTFIDGWRSHGTVQRQTKEVFTQVVRRIETLVMDKNKDKISVPYATHIWMAKKK